VTLPCHRAATRTHNFTCSVAAISAEYPLMLWCSEFYNKLRAPNRGTSLGPVVCGANKFIKSVLRAEIHNSGLLSELLEMAYSWTKICMRQKSFRSRRENTSIVFPQLPETPPSIHTSVGVPHAHPRHRALSLHSDFLERSTTSQIGWPHESHNARDLKTLRSARSRALLLRSSESRCRSALRRFVLLALWSVALALCVARGRRLL
jgi:hypothetical protein